MTREFILNTAQSIITGERQHSYGTPEQSFGRIAQFWSTYLDIPVSPSDVAALMALLKIARIRTSHDHTDSWIDLAGYAACGGELSAEPVVESSYECFAPATLP